MYYEQEKISEALDIYPPFLMIDGASEVIPSKRASCYVDIKGDEWFMQTHLPSMGLMPGTLLTEAMCQSAVLTLYSRSDFDGQKAIIQSMNVTLRGNISPPERIEIECSVETFRRGIAVVNAEVRSAGRRICSAILKFACPHLMPVPIPRQES